MKILNRNNWKASPFMICAVTFVSTIVLLLADYFYSNNPFPFFDDIDEFAWAEYVRRLVGETGDDDVLYINVTYDKSLIEYNDAIWGMPKGNIEITDRRKLIKLLETLSQSPNYRYVFLDVRFEKGFADNSIYCDSMTVDEKLAEVIGQMPRFVFATHQDIELLDSSLLHKCAINDYRATITATNFVRYKYLHGSRVSVPLRMYKDLYNRSIKKVGAFYFDNGKLCQNSPFFPIKTPFPDEYDEFGNKSYLELGVDIVNDSNVSVPMLTKGKIVVIGDFVEDCHDTYVGPQPGSYITYCAFKALEEGKHLVSWFSVFIMGVVYALLTTFTFSKVSLIKHFPLLNKYDSRICRFALSLLGITFVLHSAVVLLYLLDGQTFPMAIATMYLSLLKLIYIYKES